MNLNFNAGQAQLQQATSLSSNVTTSLAGVEINDRYADSIIGGCAHLYDALEVHGVRDLYAGTGRDETNFEIDNRNPQSYSVYVHAKSDEPAGTSSTIAAGPEGVDAVGDFSTYDLALAYAQELGASHGWPVHDHVVNKVPNSGHMQ